jgi:GAF domain-containing protein
MSLAKRRVTVKGLRERFLEPHAGIRDLSLRRQAYFTTLVAMILGLASLVVGLLGIILGLPAGLVVSMVILAIMMTIAAGLGRTENFLAGSTMLVSGMIVAGFTLSMTFPATAIGIMLCTIVPALFIGSLLLSPVAIIIISITKLILIGMLPLVAGVDVNSGLLLFITFIVVDAIAIVVTAFHENLDNQRLDEIETLRGRLEERVEERTRFSRIASEIAQDIASSASVDELFAQAVRLIGPRMGFSFTGIFVPDESGRSLVLRAAQGAEAEQLLVAGQQVAFGPPALLGWVAENKQLRVISSTAEDPLHLDAHLLGEGQSSIGIPILSRDTLLGVLEAQSAKPNAFDNETIVMLETLTNQIATSIQNVHLFESEQGGVQEVAEIYRTGYRLARARTEQEIYQVVQDVFAKASYVCLYLSAEGENLQVKTGADTQAPEGQNLPQVIEVSPEELETILAPGLFVGEGGRLNTLPYTLVRTLRQLHIFSVALIPVKRDNALSAILLVGTRESQPLSDANVQPYVHIAELVANAFDRISESQQTDRRILEMETITLVSQEISAIRDLANLYRVLHTHIRQAMGDVNFLVAIYDPKTNSIAVPYMFERGPAGGEVSSIETFPLGEGLTSILIRTKQPLMLVEDVEQKAIALGARVAGKSARSWLGAPLMVAGEVLGAIVVQDMERESAFDDTDLRFITTLSAQVAGAIFNARLLEETASRAVQLQTAAEIARDISGSLDLGELLTKAVTLIRERFNYYHAAIFLVDTLGEFANIREATGEAGMQMKRAGHKLKVGSKSIVGYVTGSGEPLIVNDTGRDATYYANPLLPETRAEVAIPLKIGTRVLGALDVQSTQPYSFSEEDVSVLRILADQLAIAVINSELFADTQEHLSQHRLLHHVTTAAASGTTLEEALNSAVQGLQVTMGGDRVIILLADKEKQALKVTAFAGYSEEVGDLEIKFTEGITGWVATHQQPQRVNDVTQDPRYFEIGSNVRSELVVPLSYRGELLGVLNVESDQVGAYNENDEEMLGTLGGSLAAVIANARLIEQVRRQVDRERMLYEITSKIRRSTDMQTIMATTTSELSKALGARRAEIKIDIENEADRENPRGS